MMRTIGFNFQVIKTYYVNRICWASPEGGKGGGGGGLDHVLREKMVLSQFTKNKGKMKITVHGELNIYVSFHGK